MSFPEYQSPGVRTARGYGEAYPYVSAVRRRPSLITHAAGLERLPKLPAGTIINIAGHLYRTLKDLDAGNARSADRRRSSPSDRRGPRSSGRRTPASFADRANVYWDAVNCCFTATVGSNVKVGYAVSNPQIGTAVNPSNSTVAYSNTSTTPPVGQGTSVTGLTEYNVDRHNHRRHERRRPGRRLRPDRHEVEVELIGS